MKTPGQAAFAWVASLPDIAEKDDDIRLRLSINDRCETVQIRSFKNNAIDVDVCRTPELAELLEALRSGMHPCGWPCSIDIKISGRNAYAPTKSLDGLHLANAQPRGHYSSRIDCGWRKDGSIDQLDDLVRASHLIASISPHSNQPVRAWSSGDNMMGTAHIRHMGIHARTEAEFLLKKLWTHGGVKEIEKIIEDGKIEKADWMTRMWFVATDLEDLDVHPMGRQVRGGDALDCINEILQADTAENTPSL